VTRLACVLLVVAVAGMPAAPDDNIVFRSDVSLVRVDAQVVDRTNHAITGLQKEDFVLLEDGQKREIKNFASEDMPMDVVLLLDVSGSMQPHIERLSQAAHQALRALGEGDRVAIMVFDRSSRVRMQFQSNWSVVERELENVLNQESFDGGTDITRGLLDAASYIGKSGRATARRAIVILTDDQTERDRDEQAVNQALVRADAVLSALLAPDAMRGGYGGMGGGGYPRGGGGGWPSAGGGMGGPLGGIIFGRRGGYGGRGGGYPGGGYPGGGGQGPVIMGRARTHSAGTAVIAKTSGGDSMSVDDASALENTLLRLRQRYTLFFSLPEGDQGRSDPRIEVALADAARRRYAGSEVRFRRVYNNADGSSTADPVVISRTPASSPRSSSPSDSTSSSVRRRRPAVNEDGTRIENTQPAPGGGWRKTDDPAPTVASAPDQPVLTPAAPQPKADPQPQQGGWRRVKPGEQP
jgi:VWFA-related protein